VDNVATEPPSGFEVGERIWIQAVKNKQVIQIFDVVSENGSLPVGTLDALVALSRKAEISSPAFVPDSQLLSASVIVPTLCRNPNELVRTIESIVALDYPDFEVILVDNRPELDRPPLPELPGGNRVRVLHEPQRGVSAARNLGILAAKGDVLAFTDDDAIVDRGWLRVLATRFTLDAEIEGIGGLVLPTELATPSQVWFEEFYGGFSPSLTFEKMSLQRLKGIDKMFPYAPGRFGAGCNAAYRRATLGRFGGFDTAIGGGTLARGGEDVGLAIELVETGGTFAYEPAALVRHTHRRTEEEFMHQVFNYGVGLTAMYTAMIVRNPRHLLAMMKRIPVGFRYLIRSPEDRSPSAKPSYPSRTLRTQILGMLYGPLAYTRSVIRTRSPRGTDKPITTGR